MTDHEKYLETLEQLFFISQSFSKVEKKEEYCLAILDSLRALILTFDSSVDTLQGQRKINALNTIKILKEIFNYLGSQYIAEIYWRKKTYKLEQSLIDAAKEIEDLKAQINVLTNLESFLNE